LGRDVLSRYGHASRAARVFLNARWRWTGYEPVAARLPADGLILDLGSGHGLLSLALGLSAPGRTVRGIEHDPHRIDIATRAAAQIPNVAFQCNDFFAALVDDSLCGAVAGIALMDTLHYLRFDVQEQLLARCRQLLRPDGVLVMRDVDAEAGKTFLVTSLHEKIATGLGLTRAEGLRFRGKTNWLAALTAAGYEAHGERYTRFPFADVLFECRPTRVAAAQAA
jgi:SAM-dependent methyltransferase